MQKTAAALVWAILLLSFFGCAVLVVAVPTGVNWYITSASRQETAGLEIISGITLLQQAGDRAEVGVMGRQSLEEGDAVRTTNDSQALIWLHDGSNIRLWPNSKITLSSLRSSRFGDTSTDISLSLQEGHCRATVALPPNKSRRLEITTPTANIVMREGSYSIDVKAGDKALGQEIYTEVIAHDGSAIVGANGKTVELLRAERTIVQAGLSPTEPLPAVRNLITNGDFKADLTTGWISDSHTEDGVEAKVELDTEDGRSIVRFERSGSQKHGEAYLIQHLNNYDVTDVDSLRLSAEIKLLEQSLSGGGWMGSEYPLMIRLKYRDINGNEALWVRGFYFQNNDNLPTSNGVAVPRDSWYGPANPIDLFDPAIVSPRPTQLLALELVASGWDFESAATNIQLLAE